MKKLRKIILNHIKTRDIEKALSTALDALEDEEDGKILFYAGYCYYLQNKYGKSVEYYKRALKLSVSPEDLLDIYKGLSKIYITYEFLYLDAKDIIEIEAALLAVLKNAKDSEYTETEYSCIVFLSNIYLYNDIEKYMSFFSTYCLRKDSIDSLAMKDRFEEEGHNMLKSYFMTRLRNFEKDLKSIVDSGGFSVCRKEIARKLECIIEKCLDLDKYYSALVEKYPKIFLEEVANLYLLFLTTRTYSGYKSIGRLLLFIRELVCNGVEIENKAAVLMVLSDFLNIPAVLGEISHYKKVYYNTLSPTIRLLRFPNEKKVVLEIYQEMENALGLSYKLKKEYLDTLVLESMTKDEILSNRQYSIKSAIELHHSEPSDNVKGGCSNSPRKISHPRNILILMNYAMQSMNIKVMNDLLCSIYEEGPLGDDVLSECLQYEKIPKSTLSVLGNEKTKEECASSQESKTDSTTASGLEDLSAASADSTQVIQAFLLKTMSSLYSMDYYRDILFSYILDIIHSKYHLNAIIQHAHVLENRTDGVCEYLIDNEKGIDMHRLYLNEIDRYGSVFDRVYGYHKFLCEYINKIVKNQIAEENINTAEYKSVYSKEYLGCKRSRDMQELNLYKYTVNANIEYFRHLLAISNYEKNRKEISLMLLRELYQERSHDYYLINDLALILTEKNESIHFVDKYLRTAHSMDSTNLFLISMKYHKKQGNWEIVERRAKEILAQKYEYKIKMALAEALSVQKKYKYAIKIVEEVESDEMEKNQTKTHELSEMSILSKSTITDESSSRLASVRIFKAYLHIKIGKLEEALEIINALLEENLEESKKNKAIQYKKYIHAIQIREAICTEEVESVLKITEEYSKLKRKCSGDEKWTEMGAIIGISDAYVELVDKILKNETGAENRLTEYLSTDDQQELITLSKLLLLLASVNNELNNPVLHNAVSHCIKKANLQGETKESLEVELLLRMIRDEDIEDYYQDSRKSEETPFARILLSILYDPTSLAPITREYLKSTTIMDTEMLKVLAKIISEQNNPRDNADLEAIFLHLCRRYSAEEKEVNWLYKLLKIKN
ncbi:hypothetical protein NEMIN01_0828 [Nematocida minor]|uniref:uncharacterized protein n=1 Tax=Nematocida minor TaxID=1912983 RepID=UPI0022210ECB|nr:uncharacterized protein NEMIN01_0828 [Nematocida minor]KAI5190043.1 hypothetical protein NEMIN01_0828 [Nematocida minor]